MEGVNTLLLTYGALLFVCGFCCGSVDWPDVLRMGGEESRFVWNRRFTLLGPQEDRHRNRRSADRLSEPEAESEGKVEAESMPKAESEGRAEAESVLKAESETYVEAESVPKAESEGKAEAESGPKTESEGKAEAESGPKAESEGKAEAESGPRAESEGKVEAESGPMAESEGKAEAESGPNAESEGKAEAESGPNAENEGKAEAESGAKAESKGQVEAESGPKAESEGKAEAESEPKAESEGKAEAESGPNAESEGKAEAESGAKAESEGQVEAESGPKAESEGKAEAESGPKAESEGNAEAESEPKAESERLVEAESGAKAESGPKAESEGKAETESGSKAESEGLVEAESGPKAESEGKADTESGPKAESEGRAEAESGPKAETEAKAEAESWAEGEAESGPKVKSEAKAEVASETVAEGKSEPEEKTNGEPSSEAEGAGEPKAEAEMNGKAEAGGEPESRAETESEGAAEVGTGVKGAEEEEYLQPHEILMPPILLLISIEAGLGLLTVWTQREFHVKRFQDFVARITKNHSVDDPEPTDKTSDEDENSGFHSGFQQNGDEKHKSGTTASTPGSPVSIDMQKKYLAQEDDNDAEEKQKDDYELEFFSDFDLEVLGNLGSHNNQTMQLVRVATPALLSLALCPLTLYLYEPLVQFFWDQVKFPLPPDINGAISCFLVPAGLVYATSFGFAFQQALTKQESILAKMTHELGLLDQIVTMTSKLNLPSLRLRMDIYKAVKAETIFLTLQVMDAPAGSFENKPVEDVTIHIWSILDQLRNIVNQSPENFDLDAIMVSKIVGHVLELNSICSDRMGSLHARIHPLKWAFLESLGFFSYFGILLLQAQSYKTDLTMCIITVFSISLLCYIVSDLDAPFCGFFRIDLTALPEVVMRTRKAFELTKKGHNVVCTYPNKANTGYGMD